MKYSVFPGPAAARKARQSMALVITLSILALLSILLVSFVSMALLDRGATASYSQSLPADQIAQGGLDQIISQFQAEISTLSTNSQPTSTASNLYIPLAATNAVPQRTAPAAGNLATLLSYSGTNLYVGTPDYSSACLTQTPSVNGRSVSTAVWNQPQLTTSTASFPSPKWILMTRAGPQAFSTYTSALGNSALNNSSYAVGRFAYVVYDTSGLLDANVAGYPSGAAANATGKGLMPWADLTQLTNPAGVGPNQSDVDNLVNWRNATTASNAASYVTNVGFAATNNGFTRVANGDTCFLGRQDLIKYAQQATNSSGVAGDWTNALPYLTTFSREINGPTWGPTVNGTGASYQYATNQYASGSLNPRIPNPRVQATGTFTRANGLPAIPGEPLVKYRFPLDKLALLESVGTTYTTAQYLANKNNIQTQIQQYFGLDMGTNSAGVADGNGPAFRHWSYPTTNAAYPHNMGTSGGNGIMSLDDVATYGNREPDFFELLQAGMLSGSLGVPGKTALGAPNPGRYDKYPVYTSGTSTFTDPDDSATLQTLRVGANIIDQWDVDSFPTTITYLPKGGLSISVQGIEDLPYPEAAYFNCYASSTGTTGSPTASFSTPLPPFNFYLYFELWNPHQQASSINTANYPTSFRFFPFNNNAENLGQAICSDSFVAGFANSRTLSNPGTSESWFYNDGGALPKNGSNGAHTYVPMINSAPSGVLFSYSPTASTNDYREPALALGTPVGAPMSVMATNFPPLTNIACLVLPPLTNFPAATSAANNDHNAPFPAIASGAGGPNGGWQCQYDVRFVMPVQYQDPGTLLWHTYSTFVGIDDQSGAYAAGTYCEGYTPYGWTPPNTTALLSTTALVKSDPRTFRFGVASASGNPDYDTALAGPGGLLLTENSGLLPFGAIAPYRLDMWAANSGTSTYPDIDGFTRWGDARNAYQLSPVTSPIFTGESANRPVILNRPFQSVGELGYVYRDMPWKTLDLFSANSADSALLDLFTLNDAPTLAGRVSPNTPYPQVLAALISGANQSTVNGTTVSSANALAIGQAIQATTAVTPFVTRADIVTAFMTNSHITSMSSIKTEEEAAVRSVAESANTRTWTFLIDIIAQSGRYPSTAGTLDNFVVEGERRYWLHVSIDRYTGQVVEKQLEVVNE